MNLSQQSILVLNQTSMEPWIWIINTPYMSQWLLQSRFEIDPTPNVWRNWKYSNPNEAWCKVNYIVQDSSNNISNMYLNQLPSLSSYCLCNDSSTSQILDPFPSKKEDFDVCNFESYKQLRNAIRQSNPEFTREQCYEELLKPFRHEKIKTWDSSLSRFKISYVCKFEDCNKEFTKVWNMVDHMRMHQSIKPYICQICKNSFTQKGNLKKTHLYSAFKQVFKR